MSLFKDLFKRKAGGTMVGNLLRGAAHTFNPLLGNGAMLLKNTDSMAVPPPNDVQKQPDTGSVLESFKGFLDGVKTIGSDGVTAKVSPTTILLIAAAALGIIFFNQKK